MVKREPLTRQEITLSRTAIAYLGIFTSQDAVPSIFVNQASHLSFKRGDAALNQGPVSPAPKLVNGPVTGRI